MSRRRKLEKFATILKYPHVFEMTEPGKSEVRQHADTILKMNGKWKELAFPTPQKLCLELACGRGEYTLGLGRLNPDVNYMGVDVKGARIYQGATISLKENLTNVAFLRIRIEQIGYYFEPGEIDEIWITFPDPFAAKPNRRLTSESFLDKYYDLLVPEAHIHLKTDDKDLFDYSVEVAEAHEKYRIIEQNENISEIRQSRPELNIQTYYERLHIDKKKTIKYLHLVKNG